jgi:N-acetylglucosaminyldiphosphoundecaprenol N-acetyl-beta-D-mannosaminyltransferase
MTELTPTSFVPEFRICGIRVHAVQVNDALEVIREWMSGDRKFHSIASTNINNVSIALEDPEYFRVMEGADLSLPDGVPLLWFGRRMGFPLRMRCGIEEVMEGLFEASNRGERYRHFFYGNSPQVLEDLKARLLELYPNLQIAGMYSPPFRPLTAEEDRQDIQMINESQADFLWVSLGCPRQERWVYDHRDQLDVVAAGGAGAVFNFISGDKTRAPSWIRYLGLEWLFRLALEPRRLFTRYCIRYPKFALTFVKQAVRGKIALNASSPVRAAELENVKSHKNQRSRFGDLESDQ